MAEGFGRGESSSGNRTQQPRSVIEGSGELLEIHWVSLADTQKLELPNVTRMVLQEVQRRLDGDYDFAEPGPFVYFKHGKPVVDTV